MSACEFCEEPITGTARLVSNRLLPDIRICVRCAEGAKPTEDQIRARAVRKRLAAAAHHPHGALALRLIDEGTHRIFTGRACYCDPCRAVREEAAPMLLDLLLKAEDS